MTRRPLPEHGSCLVCGTENPKGFGVTWYASEDGTINGNITLTESHQGPPNLAHGGASAALLDEAMGAAVWYKGHSVVVVNLNLDYLKPVPLNQEIEVIGRVAEVGEDGKVIKANGEIRLPDGEVAVKASGIYVNAPQFFDKLINKFFQD
jgi:uncharacterized protein (TIGR00369 family)